MLKVARFEFSLFGINTYVVYDEQTRECAIIDPGMISDGERDALKHFIERERLNPVHLINTHLHIDHSIGNEFVEHTWGLKAEAHRADSPLGSELDKQAKMFGLPFPVKSIQLSTFLEDGDEIKIGNSVLRALHVPGHSPGSIVLYAPVEDFIIAGDVIFSGSIGRTDLPGGSFEQLIGGIRTKLLPLPPATVIYPGHGPETTLRRELESNPYLR